MPGPTDSEDRSPTDVAVSPAGPTVCEMDTTVTAPPRPTPTGRLIGYARHQDPEALTSQVAELARIGVPGAALYTDLSADAGPLPGLDAALAALDAGDWLVVTTADRLSGDRAGLASVFARIEAVGATFAPQGIPTPREVLLSAIHVAHLPDLGAKWTRSRNARA